ncbi:alpha/beta fold hydrolase [Psychrobacter okhotskensis]|uniref:alpha/beta fold hydrolase n=1 Tax=Psychrobacter TaxID=497 RepID=UPI000C323E1B|nr:MULTISPECIES: alpha/beta hydrolase [Psychrobacter]NRD70828.1 alpha/beta fold hydrolase [Psychrobacter okhotskensis]PKG35607.1 alpha/beta hydrolase [Psychrobacter sp. Sarcosine-3u-12]
MPTIEVNNANINYEDSAPNDTQKPVMVFAHGLLWNTRIYDKQVEHFQDRYRCIAFDFRGQGQSQITKDGYDMDTLADDAIALLAALDIDSCHYVGLSMGGFVGQRIAIRRPELLKSLTLIDTSADAEDPDNIPGYKKLMTAIRWLGMKRVSKKVMPIMFGSTFLEDKSRKADQKEWLAMLNGNRKGGVVKATMGVIERDAIYDQIDRITTPTLIIVGDEDVATPYAKAERMHFAIDGSKLAIIKGSGHTSTVEEPEQVNKVLSQFLTSCVS